MPCQPSRKVSNCVETSRKQNDEEGPSQDSVTSHISPSSQVTLVVDQADRVSTKEPLPSRPTGAAKVECLQQLPAAITSDNESVEDHELRRDRQRFNEKKWRANEDGKIDKTVKQRQRLLETKRQYEANYNVMKMVKKRGRHLEQCRRYNAKYKANESVEQRQRRLEKKRQYNAIYNSKKHFEQRQQGLIRRKYDISEKNVVQHYREQQERKRLYDKKRRADAKSRADVTTKNESVADRERRLEKRQYSAIRRSKDNIEQRQQRLEWQRLCNYIRSYNESIEQRQRRLERQRQYMTICKAMESVERREQRLERNRKYKAKMRAKNKINKDDHCIQSQQKGATRESVEHNCITRDGDDDVENIKTGQSNVSEQFPYICYQKHEGAEMHGDGLKEIKQRCPEYGDIDSSEQRDLSEEKLRKLAIKHMDIRQYLSTYLFIESAEQDEQHLPKTTKYGTTQTVSESVKECNLQDISTRIADEIVVKHEPGLEEQHELYLRDKGRDSRDADTHLDTFAEIKIEPSNGEYDPLYGVTAWNSIADLTPNVNGDVVYAFDPLDGISSNYIRTEDNVLEEEYEVGGVLKIEIDVEAEGVQPTTPKQNNSKVDNIQGITDDVMQKLLEERGKENIVDAPCIDTTRETRPLRPPPRRHARLTRFNESENHELHRKRSQQSMARRLTNKTVEQRQRRLEKKQLYYMTIKSKESVEQRQQRLERQRQYWASIVKASAKVRKQKYERYQRILELKANESVEQREQRLLKLRELTAKSKVNKPDGTQQRLDNGSIEDYITGDSDNDVKNIQNEASSEQSQQLCCKSASTSISDPLLPARPTRAAKVICLQQISEVVSEESSGDESPLASYRRYQQHEDTEVHLHRLKEIQQCYPEYGDIDSSEQRELSEEKLRQLAIEHVDDLRVMCRRINVQEYVPKYRIKEYVDKDEQHLPKTIIYGTTQTVSECFEKHKQDDVPTHEHEQSLEEQHVLYLRDKEGFSKYTDTQLDVVERIKIEPSDSIADPKTNVNFEDNMLCEYDPLGGISSNEFNIADGILKEEYESVEVIKTEIDIEFEGPQQIEPKETEISMVGAIKVKNINDMQKPLDKQRGDIDNANNIVATSKDAGNKRIKKFPAAYQQCLKQTGHYVPILKKNVVINNSCQNIICKHVPTYRSKNSVEQDKEHLPEQLECESTQTISDHVDHNHQNASKYKANENIEKHEECLETERQHCAVKAKGKLSFEQRQRKNENARLQRLYQKANESVEDREQRREREKQRRLRRIANESVELREQRRLRDRKNRLLRKANEVIEPYLIAEGITNHGSKEIQSGISKQEHYVLGYVIPPMQSHIEIPKLNVYSDDLPANVSADGNRTEVKNIDNVLMYDVCNAKRDLKMELHVETKGPSWELVYKVTGGDEKP